MEHKNRLYPSNPLGIIATFVFFIEAISASTVFIIKDNECLLERVINFIIIFPSVIAGVFFLILIFKRQILFGPNDFKNDDSFIKLINSRIQNLERGQKVNQATANPPTNLDSVLELVDELIENKEFKNVVRIGRGYLKLNEFGKTKRFFEHVKKKTPKTEDFYYTIVSNIAYSQIGLKQYEDAIEELKEVESILGNNLQVWHLAAFSYAYYKLGNKEKYKEYLKRCKAHKHFENEKDIFEQIYKDFDKLWS